MAKKGIHPEYHTINVQMTDGTTYATRSTYGKEGDTIQLDVDPKTHPAWVGGVNLRKTGRLESFTNRFGSIGALKTPTGKPAKEEPKAAKKEEPKAAKEEKKDDQQSA